MRGSETFDGKIAGNRQMVDRYNEAKGRKKGIKGALQSPQTERLPKTTGGESGGAREAGGHDEIKTVAEEHGPAGVHVIMRSPQGYHSITHHEDGHVHHADHATLGEAQEHGAHAMGDTEHLGDMPKDDYEVAEEKDEVEKGGGAAGSRVGYMS
ncbi:MAG TPA: hypothetical protein VF772_17520 [Terriglobales bacterium]